MSYFTVAVNEILDRMKTNSGTTRQQFAARIGMPMSSFFSYAAGRTSPDADAVKLIVSGFEEADARRIVTAHILDETPEEWHSRVSVQGGTTQPGAPIRLADCEDLPAKFRRQIGMVLEEARRNEHVIGFIDEFVALLGLETKPPAIWPIEGKLPVQPVPVGIVHGTSRLGGLTPAPEQGLRAAEKTPAKGPRSRSTRGIQKVSGAKKTKPES